MRFPRLAPLLLLVWGSCASSETVPEPGAILLQVKNAPGAPAPDELLVWVYDETGVLWDGARIPETGSLAPQGEGDLGTILLQPGTIQGELRVHLKGLFAGMRTSDGILVVATLSGTRILDIVLEVAEPPDADADGVPDAVDDCISTPNPRQGGCPQALPDAGFDAGLEDALVAAVADRGPETGSMPDLLLPGNDQREDWRGAQLDAELDGPVGTTDDAPSLAADVGLADDAISPVVTDDAPSLAADVVSAVPDVAAEPADQALETLPDVTPAAEPPVEAGAEHTSEGKPDAATEDGDDGASTVDSGDASTGFLAQGSPCSQNEACASGSCADGVCCTNPCLGPCRSCSQPNADGVCQAYLAGYDPEGECGGATCNGAGACGTGPPPGRSNGELCTSPGQCLSGFCTDGVCCNSACKDPCQSCGSGACQTIHHADDIPECTGGMTCNNKGKCVGS
jgi:hypothetical protein